MSVSRPWPQHYQQATLNCRLISVHYRAAPGTVMTARRTVAVPRKACAVSFILTNTTAAQGKTPGQRVAGNRLHMYSQAGKGGGAGQWGAAGRRVRARGAAHTDTGERVMLQSAR